MFQIFLPLRDLVSRRKQNRKVVAWSHCIYSYHEVLHCDQYLILPAAQYIYTMNDPLKEQLSVSILSKQIEKNNNQCSSDNDSSDRQRQASDFNPTITQLLLNSVKINKKIHGQIVAKEFQMKTETHQLNQKMYSLYREMQEVYSKTQILYEQTVRQNKKSRFLAEELIKPFREQLRSKVDETSLNLKMKMLLSEFDSMGHRISYDRQGVKLELSGNETFQFVQKELLPIIVSLQKQLARFKDASLQQKEQIRQIQQKDAYRSKDIENLNTSIKQINTQFRSEIDKKINEELLQVRLRHVYDTLINSSLHKLRIELLDKINEMTFNEIQITHPQIEPDFMHKMFAKHQKAISELKELHVQQNQKIQANIKTIKKKNEEMEAQTIAFAKQLINNQTKVIKEDNNQLKTKLSTLSQSVRAQVVAGLNKGILGKIQKLDIQYKNISDILKLNEKKITLHERELTSIKSLLSQKANFSDFVRVLQMKADKQDYRELKDMIQVSNPADYSNETKQMYKESNINQINQTVRFKTTKKSLSSHRSSFNKSPSLFKQVERDSSINKYMLGFDTSSPDRYRQRNRIMHLTQTEKIHTPHITKGDV